jgi:hypothetical protein
MFGALCECARRVCEEHARNAIDTVLARTPSASPHRDVIACSGELSGVPVPHPPGAQPALAQVEHAAEQAELGAAECHAGAFGVALAVLTEQGGADAGEIVARMSANAARADACAATASGLLAAVLVSGPSATLRQTAEALSNAEQDVGFSLEGDAWRHASDAWASLDAATQATITDTRSAWRTRGVRPALFATLPDLGAATDRAEPGLARRAGLGNGKAVPAAARVLEAMETGDIGLLLPATVELAPPSSMLGRLAAAAAARRAADPHELLASATDLVAFYSDEGRALGELRRTLFAKARKRGTRR